ncbi:MAG: helix-hairpin-helix domain-containing protein [Actinobacteria bacterium]|nr:helix-hairpin-helix domain-containing protein [Actinomycetota bacterium]MCL5887850.1 helix-hairpin-helix domain-containing protein [Actinomycetota bacterium]
MNHPTRRGSLDELLARAGLAHVNRYIVYVGAAIFICGIVFALFRWWPGGLASDQEFSIDAPVTDIARPENSPGSATETVSAAVEATLVVHVAGAVLRPGVVECPPGSRVQDAISLAGGPLGNASTDAINLARLLTDGEQIFVPTHDQASTMQQGSGGRATVGSSDPAVIDLNSATAEELQSLPGIGPSISERIVADREANGPFGSPEDLMRVSGIGQKRFDSLKEMISVR